MTKYSDEARALVQDALTSRTQIRTFNDPHLNAEGLRARREEAQQVLQAKLTESVVSLRTRAEAVAGHARNVANSARPRIANDPAALIRSEQKWRQVQLLLESGRELRDVVSSADLDTLLAIEEWAPTWLAAQSPARTGIGEALSGKKAPTTVDISRPVQERLKALVPPEVAAKLDDASEKEADFRAALPHIERAELIAQGRDYAGGNLEAALIVATAE